MLANTCNKYVQCLAIGKQNFNCDMESSFCLSFEIIQFAVQLSKLHLHPRYRYRNQLSLLQSNFFATITLWLYNDVIMGAIASQITSLTIVYSIVYSDADQRKHQSSGSLAFVRGIHRGPVHSPHKWPVTRKMFPFDDVIMALYDMILLMKIKMGPSSDKGELRWFQLKTDSI